MLAVIYSFRGNHQFRNDAQWSNVGREGPLTINNGRNTAQLVFDRDLMDTSILASSEGKSAEHFELFAVISLSNDWEYGVIYSKETGEDVTPSHYVVGYCGASYDATIKCHYSPLGLLLNVLGNGDDGWEPVGKLVFIRSDLQKLVV